MHAREGEDVQASGLLETLELPNPEIVPYAQKEGEEQPLPLPTPADPGFKLGEDRRACSSHGTCPWADSGLLAAAETQGRGGGERRPFLLAVLYA